MFLDEHPDGTQAVSSEPATHPFYFPAPQIDSALATAAAHEGLRQAPLQVQPHIPTMAVNALSLAAGASHAPPRSTANRLLLVASGHGTAQAGASTFHWSRGDVIAVPTWTTLHLAAASAATVVAVSDAPVMRALGFYREE